MPLKKILGDTIQEREVFRVRNPAAICIVAGYYRRRHAIPRIVASKVFRPVLEANDKLFKMIASTIHPEAEWPNWSNGVIASLYQRKQEELAKQAAIAAFRQHVADVVSRVTANQMAGAN